MVSRQPKEAEEWVERAKAFYAATGKEIALAEFTNPRGQFVKNQQYIFVMDLEGNMLAHGMNEFFVGKNFMGVKDLDGKKFVGEIIKTAREKGAGWTEYKWTDPVTKKVLPKNLYFEKVDDVIICCGTYRLTPDPSELDLL
ncbi:MAG TPA: cache domain-containing protein [Syntrophobacteraceae bacterium]|nr:cache domain-containing protein [Syntrophobacteraceae bacterium]